MQKITIKEEFGKLWSKHLKNRQKQITNSNRDKKIQL